jgi:hypothetical protein
MAKIITNTTGSDITIASAGLVIAASASYTIEVQEYLLWASTTVLAEVSPYITSGDLVVNDGVQNLSVGDAINFLEYPDTAFNARFLSEPERSNGFASKTVQEAIEEAAGVIYSTTPTTTVGAVTAVAYTTTLDPSTVYKFKSELDARRTDVVGETGVWELHTRVKRDGAAPAALVGFSYQGLALRDDQAMDTYWDISGNQVQLKVVGVAGKTIKWQPKVTFVKVS